MKLYKLGEFVYQYAEGKAPAGAVPYEPEKPKAPKPKASKPKNKAAKPADK